MPATPWVKATASSASAAPACIEVRRADGRVEMRDTKDRERGPILRFSPAAFSGCLDTARFGGFDHLGRAAPGNRRPRGTGHHPSRGTDR